MSAKIQVGDEVRCLKQCKGCGKWMYPKRADAVACSKACSKRIERGKSAKCDISGDSEDRRCLSLRKLNVSDLYNDRVLVVELPQDLAERVEAGQLDALDVIVVEPAERLSAEREGVDDR